jgi:hypothetical protein
VPVHVLAHHDGVVDEDAEHQDEGEQRDHVDRDAERAHHGERAEERHRHADAVTQKASRRRRNSASTRNTSAKPAAPVAVEHVEAAA